MSAGMGKVSLLGGPMGNAHAAQILKQPLKFSLMIQIIHNTNLLQVHQIPKTPIKLIHDLPVLVNGRPIL